MSRHWQNLLTYLPPGLQEGLVWRSAVASTFAASLEMAREGQLKIQQDEAFAPIFLKSGSRAEDAANDDDEPAPPLPAAEEETDDA